MNSLHIVWSLQERLKFHHLFQTKCCLRVILSAANHEYMWKEDTLTFAEQGLSIKGCQVRKKTHQWFDNTDPAFIQLGYWSLKCFYCQIYNAYRLLLQNTEYNTEGSAVRLGIFFFSVCCWVFFYWLHLWQTNNYIGVYRRIQMRF